MRYAVYDPRDPRKGKLLPDAALGQIILGEGETITKGFASRLAACRGSGLGPKTATCGLHSPLAGPRHGVLQNRTNILLY